MKKFLAVLALACAIPALASTWYVRPDGGTRYTSNMSSGQCDGLADAAYPGSGVNQHCAFKDVRYLWSDGEYNYGTSTGFPAWGWIGQGGDTYIIRGSIADGVTYRVGWNGQSYCDSTQCWGVTGDPFGSGAPVPPSGTAAQPTVIEGGNAGSCHAASDRTQLHGGYGAYAVLNMQGASYVNVSCLDITDFSACGRATQQVGCSTGNPLDDYASNGILWSNSSTHDTLTDVRIHGLATNGMLGPTGDGVTMSYIDILGNPSSGWNADNGDGTTGTGTLNVSNFSIIGNGCAEEYPIPAGDTFPYGDCTDQNSGGYGDGFGTATTPSSPGWQAHFDQGVVAYNTQDGLDALHLTGAGSSMTITRVLAYGNMGNQIKVGGASGTAMNNEIVGNCRAMSLPIPGFPGGYNTHLSDFCRADDEPVLLTAGKGSTLKFDFNTIYTAGTVGVDLECDGSAGPCDSSALVDYRDNIFVGFADSPADGDPSGNGRFPTPIYNGTSVDFFGNPGSLYSNNATFGARDNWTCPADHETNALCADPGLTDETWHLYGYGNMAPTATSLVDGAGAAVSGVTTDLSGIARAAAPTIGALEFGSASTSATPPPPVASTPPPPPPVPPSLPVRTIPLQLPNDAIYCFAVPGSNNQACFNGTFWFLQ